MPYVGRKWKNIFDPNIMEKEQLLNQLIELVEKLSVTVKYDRGNFMGGLFRYRDDNYFYINRKADLDVKIQTIVNELKQVQIPEELLSSEIKESFPELLRTIPADN